MSKSIFTVWFPSNYCSVNNFENFWENCIKTDRGISRGKWFFFHTSVWTSAAKNTPFWTWLRLSEVQKIGDSLRWSCLLTSWLRSILSTLVVLLLHCLSKEFHRLLTRSLSIHLRLWRLMNIWLSGTIILEDLVRALEAVVYFIIQLVSILSHV